MGLDIYTYVTSLSPEAYAAAIKAGDEFDEKLSKVLTPIREKREAGEMTSDEYLAKREEVIAELFKQYEGRGLKVGEYGVQVDEEGIEIDSTKFPKHLWKIGYCRSSYNSGGFDSIAKERGCPTLDEIFGYDDEYRFVPDWAAVRARAVEAHDRMHTKSIEIPFTFADVTINPFRELGSKEDFIAELVKRVANKDTGCFSSMNTLFDMTPITGKGEGPFSSDGMGDFVACGIVMEESYFGGPRPKAVLAFKKKDVGDDDFYVQALAVLIEHCDYILAEKAKDPTKTYLVHWSG
jgi:hypothetical protein